MLELIESRSRPQCVHLSSQCLALRFRMDLKVSIVEVTTKQEYHISILENDRWEQRLSINIRQMSFKKSSDLLFCFDFDSMWFVIIKINSRRGVWRYSVIWYDMTWNEIKWHDTIRYDIMWHLHFFLCVGVDGKCRRWERGRSP